VFFKDGSKAPLSRVDYPLGHRKRRNDGIPMLMEKLERNVARVFAEKQRRAILAACSDRKRLAAMPVDRFIGMLIP